MGTVVVDKKIKTILSLGDKTCLKLLDDFEKEKNKIIDQYNEKMKQPFLRITKKNKIVAERDKKIREVFNTIVNERLLTIQHKMFYKNYYNDVIKPSREKKIMNEELIVRDIYDKYNVLLKNCKTTKEKNDLRVQRTNEIKQKINKRTLRNRKLLTDKILHLNEKYI